MEHAKNFLTFDPRAYTFVTGSVPGIPAIRAGAVCRPRLRLWWGLGAVEGVRALGLPLSRNFVFNVDQEGTVCGMW